MSMFYCTGRREASAEAASTYRRVPPELRCALKPKNDGPKPFESGNSGYCGCNHILGV